MARSICRVAWLDGGLGVVDVQPTKSCWVVESAQRRNSTCIQACQTMAGSKKSATTEAKRYGSYETPCDIHFKKYI